MVGADSLTRARGASEKGVWIWGFVEKRIQHFFFLFLSLFFPFHTQSHNYCTALPVAVLFAVLDDEMYAQTTPRKEWGKKKMGGRGKYRQKSKAKHSSNHKGDTDKPKKQRRRDKGEGRGGKERQSRVWQGKGKQSRASLCKHWGQVLVVMPVPGEKYTVAENRGIFCPGISAQIHAHFYHIACESLLSGTFLLGASIIFVQSAVFYCTRAQLLSIRGKPKIALSTRADHDMIRHSKAGTAWYGHESSNMGNPSIKVRERARGKRGWRDTRV